jgi:hypothetical protein
MVAADFTSTEAWLIVAAVLVMAAVQLLTFLRGLR